MYENSDDLTNESTAKKVIEDRWRCRLVKLPRSYRVDFAAVRDGSERVVSWVEYKRRRMQWGQYPTIVLSLSKLMAMQEYESLGTPALFVVEDNDGDIRYYRVGVSGDYKGMLEIGGRTVQTRDPADVEPVVMIPIDRFMRMR